MKSQNTHIIGIIGGRGKIGIMAINYLIAETEATLLIGGRNLTKGQELASRFPQRVTALEVDIFDTTKLNEFCRQCHVVVNLAGPTLKIMDRIALAALSNNCHYIDVGGYDLLIEALTSKIEEIKEKELVFIVGAGWMPGVSGIFPKSVIETSSCELDTINVVNIYYGASEAWSYNSCLDLTWSLSLESNGIFEWGKWKLVETSKYTKKMFFPPLNKSKYTTPYFDNQLKNIAKSLRIPHFGNYVIVNSKLSMLSSLFIKIFLRGKAHYAAKIMEKEARISSKKGSWGLIYCIVEGIKDGLEKRITAYIHEKDNYRPTGIVSAIAASFVLQNRIEKGLGYLCHKVNSHHFMSELKSQNIIARYE
jgi:saccharopine dehydrogenase-like NADP-dependent oxidoreductase